MKKPLQYLLVGFPYSGKSTLAKELVRKLGFVHINIDELKFKRGFKDTGDDDVPDKVWEDIFKEADNLLVKYLKEGKNVVNEYAWITKEWRNRAKSVAEKAGFKTRIIYLKVPEEEIRKRWSENDKSKKRFHWPEKEFEQMLKDFESITSDEDYLVYSQLIPLSEWIKENFN